MVRFFTDAEARPAEAVAFNHPRPMTAASEVIDVSKRASIRGTQAWQRSAYDYYDQVGELKFAFGLISQVVARALLYVAIIEDSAEVPIDTQSFLKTLPPEVVGAADNTRAAISLADEALADLVYRSVGQSEMLRSMALNLSIPGECYLVDDTARNRWTIASVSELLPGDPPRLRSTRPNATQMNGQATTSVGRELSKKAYVARIWRSHPRWYDEPDSSMLGVLDQVEKVVLFDQVMRTIARSRMNAGVIYVPNGLTAASGKTVDEGLIEATTTPVEDETSGHTVTPLLLSGPPELGQLIKFIELGRKIDADLLAASDRAIDRMLAGLDIPKDVVSGMAEVRYANSVIIDDSLYKAHIEPLILLICDALTTAYLQPLLKKKRVPEALVRKLVVWYNPSQIVTRPDRSTAANEGFDRFLLSGEAWRRARGYSDLDKPSDDELIKRLALEKIQIPPEIAAVLVEAVSPEFFEKARSANQEEAGVPPEVAELLGGKRNGQNDGLGGPKPGPKPGTNPAQAPPPETPARRQEASGGAVSQGGSQPPRNPRNLPASPRR
jgi:hypothetical protein